jgi:hypothetical protein
MADHL